MRSTTLVALSILHVALLPSMPIASACDSSAGTGIVATHQINPFDGRESRYSECGWTTSDIACIITPLFEFGDPTPQYGYRQGVYAYECETSSGSHTETSASVYHDFGEPQCVPVPYLAVAGQQVPGSGESYCTIRSVNESREEEPKVPEVVPTYGVVLLFFNSISGSYDYRSVNSAEIVSVCLRSGSDDQILRLGAVAAESVEVRYLHCPH